MRYACHLLNVVLGSSMSSRLFQEIREKRGLAYSVYSFSHSHEDTGILGVYAGISPENVRETLLVIKTQLHRLSREPIPTGELNAAKEYLLGSMYLNAESTDSRMNRMAKNEFLFGRYVTFEEVEKKIKEVSSETVLEWFLSLYEASDLALLLLGPGGYRSRGSTKHSCKRLRHDAPFSRCSQAVPGETPSWYAARAPGSSSMRA